MEGCATPKLKLALHIQNWGNEMQILFLSSLALMIEGQIAKAVYSSLKETTHLVIKFPSCAFDALLFCFVLFY